MRILNTSCVKFLRDHVPCVLGETWIGSGGRVFNHSYRSIALDKRDTNWRSMGDTANYAVQIEFNYVSQLDSSNFGCDVVGDRKFRTFYDRRSFRARAGELDAPTCRQRQRWHR